MKSTWQIFEESKETWNTFIEQNSSEFRQLFEWGDYKNRLGWDVLRLACIDENGTTENLIQVFSKRTLFIGSIYIPGDFCGKIDNLNQDFVNFLKKHLGVSLLYIRLDSPKRENEEDIKFLQNFGFKRPSYKLNTLEYCEIDLTKSNELILKEAKQKWRYHHKRSLDKGLELKVETKAEHLIEINRELTKDWNIRNTFTEREVLPLIDHMKNKLITCTAKNENGDLVGIRVAVISGKKAYHLYNAVSKKGRDSLPGYRLLIFMLDELRKHEIKYFNLGSTNKERFPGPYRFKYQLGYKNSLYNSIGEWNYTNSLILEKFLNFLIKVYFNSSSLIRVIYKNF